MANIIKKFFTKEELDILQPYCKVRIQESRFLPSEEQSPYVPHFVDDPLGTVFHTQKKSLIEKFLGKSLNTTYVYWRYYGHGSILDMHTDRPACEWSVTACIDKTHDWPLIVKGEEIELRVGCLISMVVQVILKVTVWLKCLCIMLMPKDLLFSILMMNIRNKVERLLHKRMRLI